MLKKHLPHQAILPDMAGLEVFEADYLTVRKNNETTVTTAILIACPVYTDLNNVCGGQV